MHRCVLHFLCYNFVNFLSFLLLVQIQHIEMPTSTEYINQYFKLKMFIFLNLRVFQKFCYLFKKTNFFNLKYCLIYSVDVGISEHANLNLYILSTLCKFYSFLSSWLVSGNTSSKSFMKKVVSGH